MRHVLVILVFAILGCRKPATLPPPDGGEPPIADLETNKRVRLPAQGVLGWWALIHSQTETEARDLERRIRDAGSEDERNFLRSMAAFDASDGFYHLHIGLDVFVLRDPVHVIDACTYHVTLEDPHAVTIVLDGDGGCGGSITFFLGAGDTLWSPEMGRRYGSDELKRLHKVD